MALGDATSFTVVGSRGSAHSFNVTQVRPLYVAATATTTDNGEWLDTTGWKSASYVVDGITTGTVLFRAWNGATKPANTEHGEAMYGVATSSATLVASLTADGYIYFPGPTLPHYIKAYISVGTTIALNLNLKVVAEVS